MRWWLKKRVVWPVAIIVSLLAFEWYWQTRPMFPNLVGPAAVSQLPAAADFVLDKESLPRSGESALALWLTETDSSWYGVVDGLSALGIPFRVVTDADQALQHNVVMIYPRLTGANVSSANLQAIATHVRDGGTVVASMLLGGGLGEVFGFETASETNEPRMLLQSGHAATAFIQEPTEAEIFFAKTGTLEEGLPAVSYRNTKHPPVATFDDGTAAITHNFYETANGMGHAYALGFDLGHFILRAHSGRLPDRAETYVNAYQPKIDSLLRLISAVYRDGEPDAVLVSPTPQGREVTVLMTHDIDFTRSIANAPVYAEAENAAKVPATYFIQTKYVKDYNDDAFLSPDSQKYLQQLNEAGMEIASHSVAHSKVFDMLGNGNGAERYPSYRPFVDDDESVIGATIGGELRVSSFLLEALAGKPVVSFRPGHLSFPDSLPQMLEATGFRYSSSVTANEALTHLPFHLMFDRGYNVPVNVHEFPVTIEDEEGRLGDRVQAAIAVADSIARYHGLVTVLVHTDSVDHKLEFTREFMTAMQNRAWFSTVRDYGDWWRIRESVALDVRPGLGEEAGSRQLTLTARGTLNGLTLELPDGWRYQVGVEGSSQNGNTLVLGPFTDKATVRLSVP